MRVFVTGANGFAGRHLVRHLASFGDEVTAGVFGGSEPIGEAESTQPIDIRDRQALQRVVAESTPEVIIHLAGVAFVPDAESQFEAALTLNVQGTFNVLDVAAAQSRPPRVVVISSGEVYGKPTGLPLTEDSPLAPANNYSATKVMAETMAEKFRRRNGLDVVIVRPFNHIGPGQDARFVSANFAAQLVQIQRGRQAPVMAVGNLDVRRDFTDVRDIVAGYRAAAQCGGGPYNLCSGGSTSIRELLYTLIDIAGVKVKIEQDPARVRPGEVPEIFGSRDRARERLSWEPHFHLRETLEDVFRDAVERAPLA